MHKGVWRQVVVDVFTSISRNMAVLFVTFFVPACRAFLSGFGFSRLKRFKKAD